MTSRSSLVLILILGLLGPVFGQSLTPTQDDRRKDDDDVVRITTNLIQVDAVVTDKKGRQVTDLRADEFEILQNDEVQKITNFSYVPLASAVKEPRVVSAPVEKNAPPTPPLPFVPIRPEQVHRTIALVVDDLGLSAESIPYVRKALKKFVNEQMQPGDYVAIMHTSGLLGVLRQFTNDKNQLLAAVELVRWNPSGRSGVSAFAPYRNGDILFDSTTDVQISSEDGDPNTPIEEFKEKLFTLGSLGTLNYIVQGLRDFPGRKSVLLFSDGIKILNTDGRSDRVLDDLHGLTDLASRSSVVIYTIDARGVPAFDVGPEWNFPAMQVANGGPPPRSNVLRLNRVNTNLLGGRAAFFDSQDGLNILAEETGGLAFRNSNNLSRGLGKMLVDQQGYYLLAYQPNEETFDPTHIRFNRITIKVKRPGLRVRYRSGFIGIPDPSTPPVVPLTREQQLIDAITAPFASDAVALNLTSIFANSADSGSYVSSLLHVDASKLTFTVEPNGWRKLVFDVMAVTFRESSADFDKISRTETVRMRDDDYRLIMENGFDYTITVPIRKPGAYQLRTALRDTLSERTGSASQYIEVPDLTRNRLALSGIIVSGFEQLKGSLDATTEGVLTNALTPDPQAGPAVRRFRRGLVLQYGFVIYNARLDKNNQRPRLQTQMRLFKDGKQMFTGRVLPYDPSAETDMKRLNAGGRVYLGTEMTPGHYVLQVIVTDLFVKDKKRLVTKWIDFYVSEK